MAEKAGCYRSTVAKTERSQQEPAWPLVVLLAKELGVSVAVFEPAKYKKPDLPPSFPKWYFESAKFQREYAGQRLS